MGNAPSSSPQEEDQNREEPSAVPIRESVNGRTVPENYTCEICIEPLLSPNTLFNNGGKCAHKFCTACVIKYIQAKLEDNIAKIPCPALDCSELLEPLTLRQFVGPELFVRWSDALCETALMDFFRSYCPNRNCSALIVDECGEDAKRVVCLNCKRPFCFQCKIPWHAGFSCEEIGRGGRRMDRNDRAFGALAERMKWKRCPRCHHFIELTDGCQIVRCRCRASFCYKCGNLVLFHGCRCEGISRRYVWRLLVIMIIYMEIAALFLYGFLGH